MIEVIYLIAIGFIVGVVARFLRPGNDAMGFFPTGLLGITGALVGGFFGRALGIYDYYQPTGLIMATFGAMAILVLVNWLKDWRIHHR